jgi:hypothetical protein
MEASGVADESESRSSPGPSSDIDPVVDRGAASGGVTAGGDPGPRVPGVDPTDPTVYVPL